MKALLLTDIPPSKDLTAGIFLEKLISQLPLDSVVCFTVLNRFLSPKISPEFSLIPFQYVTKPLENVGHHKFGALRSLLYETASKYQDIPRIVAQAVEFGHTHKVDRVWAFLQGQTMIRLAIPVAQKLNVPLYTQVYDPPNWWLRDHRVNPITQGEVLSTFERALVSSKKSAFCSWTMAEYYGNKFGIQAIPVVASYESERALPPATSYVDSQQVRITVTGQLYSKAEWNTLLATLCTMNWKIGSKEVIVCVFGGSLALQATDKMRVEFYGWRSQSEIVKFCSESDLLYCPYWFDPAFDLETRLSFPSKMVTYLASGRVVFCHAPSYSSPAIFLENNQAGYICSSMATDDIAQLLTQAISNSEEYLQKAINGRQAFDKYLTLQSLQVSLYEFLDL